MRIQPKDVRDMNGTLVLLSIVLSSEANKENIAVLG